MVLAVLAGLTVAAVPRPLLAQDAGPDASDASSMPLDETTVMIDLEELRFNPTTRPAVPAAQRPPLATEKNVDTHRPILEWQRVTDDWFGLRPQLDDRGISLQPSLTVDLSKGFRGGPDTSGSSLRHLFNANLTIDTQRLAHWPGGTFFLNFQTYNGQSGSDDLGVAQGISGIDADGRTQISELWYEQLLLDGKLRLRAGKIDANRDFAFVENAGDFIHSSFGVSPTVLGIPTYPDPAAGFDLFISPCEFFYAGVGVFDGAAQEGIPTGSRGPASFWGDPADLFLIAEAGLKWNLSNHRPGRLGVGGWRHTGQFDRFDGGAESGTNGVYAVFDQSLWRECDKEDDPQGIAMFAQYGYADPAVSPFQHHAGLGAAWTGPIPSRDDDILGLGASWVRLSDDAGFDDNNELAVELFYKCALFVWLNLQSDLQYIHNPGGLAAQDDLWVGTLRVVIDF
jgi:porin